MSTVTVQNGSVTAIGIPHKVFQQWVKEENGYRVWMEYPVYSHLSARLYSHKTN